MGVVDVDARPPAYGYMELGTHEHDGDLAELQSRMRRCAEREGCRFVATFYEYPSGHRAGFSELLSTLDREGSRHVVVPTLGHISRHYLMQAIMLDRLEEMDAEVLTLDDA